MFIIIATIFFYILPKNSERDVVPAAYLALEKTAEKLGEITEDGQNLNTIEEKNNSYNINESIGKNVSLGIKITEIKKQ